jgi:hypothetical protein
MRMDGKFVGETRTGSIEVDLAFVAAVVVFLLGAMTTFVPI